MTKMIRKTTVVGKARDRFSLDNYERTLSLSHANIVKGSIRFNESGAWANKVTVMIRCDCGLERQVATSDLAQVGHCLICIRQARNSRRKTARRAAKKVAHA